jgi:Kdo2-lipid IVA lauroyltransferase/acyltransferase
VTLRLARLLAKLPLACLHALGTLLGWTAYFVAARYRRRLQENIRQSQVTHSRADHRRLLRESVAEAGKGAIEVVVPWFQSEHVVRSLVRETIGWQNVDSAVRCLCTCR